MTPFHYPWPLPLAAHFALALAQPTSAQTPTLLPPARYTHAMVYDAQRAVCTIFGGHTGSHALGDTWSWDGAAWVLSSAAGPSPRWSHAMSYDSHRDRIVLFGGYSSGIGVLGDTWEWDGSIWTQVASAGPPPRVGHTMAFDPQRQRTVLFGGDSNTGVGGDLADTWEWDGVTWIQVATTGPTPRMYSAMAFDNQRGVTVLFGGGAFSPLGDTWEWNGTDWALAATTGPAPRGRHAMAFDSQRARTLLFGGINSGSSDQTWEWDGTTWLVASTRGVTDRCHHSMSYDSARAKTVVFGGEYGGPSNDTWEWDSLAWVEVALVPPLLATANIYGAGCGSPELTIRPATGSRPILGHAQLSLAANAYLGLAFVAWGTTPQNIDLGPAGFTGCSLWHGAEGELAAGCAQTSWNTAQHSLSIPVDPLLVGVHVYLQAWTLAPGYNPIGLATSNGIELVIGDY